MDDKYPTGILKNTATNRFHPISFRYAPPPSGDLSDGTKRYKSVGHHTDGFDTIEQAIEFVKSIPEFELMDLAWEWDGIDVPAMVQWLRRETPN